MKRPVRLSLGSLLFPGEGVAPADCVSDDGSVLSGHCQSILARDGDLQVEGPR